MSSIIADPQTLLRDACGFLGIVYDESMTRLQKPSEQYGDARGMREVKRDNSGTYRTMVSPGTRSRVERIAGPVLRNVGYRVDCTGQARRVGVVEMKWYGLIDAVAVLRNVIREVDLISAVKISVRSLAMRRSTSKDSTPTPGNAGRSARTGAGGGWQSESGNPTARKVSQAPATGASPLLPAYAIPSCDCTSHNTSQCFAIPPSLPGNAVSRGHR